jgi:hypothetical protein
MKMKALGWDASVRGFPMRNSFKFYLNLALLGFTVGRAYAAFQNRAARSQIGHGKRRPWN